MKSKRLFLEPPTVSDSFVSVMVGSEKWISLKLSDGIDSVFWDFGEPGDKRAIRKITKIKAVIDEVYEHLAGG